MSWLNKLINFEIDGFDRLIRYKGKAEKVIIPDGVEKIGEYVFEDTDVEEVVIPDSVKEIEPYAFRGCKSLKKLRLGNGLINIREYAFWGCKSLKNIFIPDSVQYIGECAFEDCIKATVVLPKRLKGILWACFIGKNAFLGCKEVITVESVWKYQRRLSDNEIDDDEEDIARDNKISEYKERRSTSKKEKKNRPSVPNPFRRMKWKGKYVFISYSSKNKDEAENTISLLKKEGIDTWYSHTDIPPGADYPVEITDAIINSSCFLILLSEKSQNSRHVLSELRTAFDENKPIIPMQIDNCNIKSNFNYYLGNQQIVKAKSIDKRDKSFKKVVETIKNCFENKEESD